MAISRVHPMFLLILSPFFLPTLLANVVSFRNCGVEIGRGGPLPGGVSVTGGEEFIEEKRKSFNVNISTDTELTNGILIAVVKRRFFLPGRIENIDAYNLCDLITCPVSPGSFVLTFRKLYSVGIKANILTTITLNGVQANSSMCIHIYDDNGYTTSPRGL